jgi:parvulin-like peptidyl-prolyl isomerase
MSDPIQQLPPEILALLRRHNLLMPLLRGLVSEEATAAISLDAEESERLLSRWRGRLGPDEALERARRHLGWTADDLDWQVQLPAKLALVARERFLGRAEARFLKRKGQLDLVTYSLVRVKEAALARELYFRLSAGEASFAELAARYSQGPERHSQGVIGPKPMDKAHPVLAERLRTARDGEVMEPFAVGEWWLVVRREALQAAVFDRPMAERMAQEALQEWIQEEAERRLARLEEDRPAATVRAAAVNAAV